MTCGLLHPTHLSIMLSTWVSYLSSCLALSPLACVVSNPTSVFPVVYFKYCCPSSSHPSGTDLGACSGHGVFQRDAMAGQFGAWTFLCLSRLNDVGALLSPVQVYVLRYRQPSPV